MSKTIKFKENLNWSDNFNETPESFQKLFNGASSREKSRVYLQHVLNPFTWIEDYEQLDIEDDYFFEFMLNNFGSSINEVAGAILRSKTPDQYTKIDQKIIKLFQSQRRTGTYVPQDADVNLDFNYENLEGNVKLDKNNNLISQTLLTFKDLMTKIKTVAFTESKNQGLLPGSIKVMVDCEYNRSIIIRARDNPREIVYLAMNDELITSLIGNSYIGAKLLLYINQLAKKLRALVLKGNKKELSDTILAGHSLSVDQKELLGDNETLKGICLLDISELNKIDVDSQLLRDIREACLLGDILISKYRNDKLYIFYRKLEVSYLALRIRNYVDLGQPITRGYVLPRDIVKYLSEYDINECETFRQLYFGDISNVDLGDRMIKGLNDFNTFELNMIVRGSDGKKILRLIVLILLTTPTKVLNLEQMPKNAKAIYNLLLLLSYEEHLFIVKGLLLEEEQYQGFIKNILNYLIYWICRGHSLYIKPLFKLYSRFEYGAMYDTHKQVLNILDSNSFLLHEVKLSTQESDPFTDSFTLNLINDLLVQSWYNPSFIRKFPRTMADTDFNKIYDYLGYTELVNSTVFKSKFSEIDDMDTYIDLINRRKGVNSQGIYELLSSVNIDIVRERFNITYHRDLSTSVIEVKLTAWNKYFSSLCGSVDFTELEFIPNNASVSQKNSGNMNYGAGNFTIISINTDDIKYTISDGSEQLEITPGTKLSRYINSLNESQSTRNKDNAVFDRLKSKYEKYKMNMNFEAEEKKDNSTRHHYFTDEVVTSLINVIEDLLCISLIPAIGNYMRDLINIEDLTNLKPHEISILSNALMNDRNTFKDLLNNNYNDICDLISKTDSTKDISLKIGITKTNYNDFSEEFIERIAHNLYLKANPGVHFDEFKGSPAFKTYIKTARKDPRASPDAIKLAYNTAMEKLNHRRNTFNFFTKGTP